MTQFSLEPKEIRSIRRRLGITQMEAGELLGGGPRAFAKYEAGSVRPSAAVVNLLRVLEANPSMVDTLRRKESFKPVAKRTPTFLEVTGAQIETVVNDQRFPALLRHLLNAEAQTYNLPSVRIHVSSKINVADGGEDGRIEWKGNPARTRFLPSRLCQFQLKAGKISPSQAGREVLAKHGGVKEMVRSVLAAGGNYIVLCSNGYTQKQIEDRLAKLLGTLRSSGIAVRDDQVEFLDADKIADWVNLHSPVASWLTEQSRPGLADPFRSWSHWAGRAEHLTCPWVDDERLEDVRAFLQERVRNPNTVARLVGLAGVGKSRLALEALRSTQEDEATGHALNTLVLYADESESSAESINSAVQRLADSGSRAIVVVDCCAPETHQILANLVSHQNSSLSLVTIDDEVPRGHLDEAIYRVIPESGDSVTEAIVGGLAPGLEPRDQRRLARFSGGFPEVAIRLGRTYDASGPTAHAMDNELVNTFILGRSPQEGDLLLKSAALFAAFGLVRMEPSTDGQLSTVASFGRDITADDLRVSAGRLLERRVVQQRGGYVSLKSLPIAMKLAERQWREWSQEDWDRVLTGDIDPKLRVSAAGQLALLNTTCVSRKVAMHVCRIRGPFERFAGLSKIDYAAVLSSPVREFDLEAIQFHEDRAVDAQVLSCLAEIDSQLVVDQIERSLRDVDDMADVDGEVRRHFVWALTKIALVAETFEDGANLLLRLAKAENERWANNATGQFKALFPVLLGNTAAGGTARLAFLDEVIETDDLNQRRIVLEALNAGSQVQHFSRSVGTEYQGSRLGLAPWLPSTTEESRAYVRGCLERLTRIALRDDDYGSKARGYLGQSLRSLIRNGFIDAVEEIAKQVGGSTDCWSEALENLEMVIRHDSQAAGCETTSRVRHLIDALQPQNLRARVQFLVTDMPWDYLSREEIDYSQEAADFEERDQRQLAAVRELAAESIGQPAILKSVLPALCRGEQRMAFAFGEAIADLTDSSSKWLKPIVTAVEDAPDEERNFDMLVGYVRGIATNHPFAVDEFKKRAAASPKLATALPRICLLLKLDARDVELLVGALRADLLPPRQLRLWTFIGFAGSFAKVPASTVAPLIDAMLDHSADAFSTAIDLMDVYALHSPERLECLRPQIRRLAEDIYRLERPWASDGEIHQYEQIVGWMLNNGREDPDARAAALSLARVLTGRGEFTDPLLVKPLVPVLLSHFPEIAWPLIGQAIVSDSIRAERLIAVLGDSYSIGRNTSPPILSLPEDTLFAWCYAHPSSAPAFVARVVPILTGEDAQHSERALHPIMQRLIEEFGDREEVQAALYLNIHAFGWSGSTTSYFEQYKSPLSDLLKHQNPGVRRWARTALRQVDASIQRARNADGELAALREVL